MASATALVSSCGSLTGIGISWTSTANSVTAVVLTSIPGACNGGTLSLTLVDSANAALASVAPTAVTAPGQTLTLSASVTATSVAGAHVSVVGP